MDRRAFLTSAGAGGAALLAGCSAERMGSDATATGGTDAAGGDTGTGGATGTTAGSAADAGDTLTVATYPPFVDAPSTSPGAWLKERFEAEVDATLQYETPDNELNYYIERATQGVEFDADVYVGVGTSDLVRVDQQQGSGQYTDPLFAEAGDLAGGDRIRDGLRFDPQGRAVPFDTGYISLVYDATADGGEFAAPETFEGLLDERYEGDLIAQNPTSSVTGQSFMLHTVEQFGPDGFLDYWADLRDNGVVVLGNWEDAYAAYGNDEAPMVVSYSTDQVYAHREDQDLRRHQVRFLNDQAYANPEGMARFADTDVPDLARRFMEFVLNPEIQAGIALRNVSFPAISDAPLPDEYGEYAQEPAEPVTFTYEELKGSLDTWTNQWARQFASG